MNKMLLCGYGNIGKKLYPDFLKIAEYNNKTLNVYDPFLADCPEQVTDLSEKYDFAFICVNAETLDDGNVDISIIENLCKQIKAEVIVIKSTIPLSYASSLPENTIFSPEFSSSTVHGGIHNYVVLGGPRNLCNKVADLYKNSFSADFEIVYTDAKTAAMAKYMTNCFLAAKVTFCNEIAEICQKENIEYDDVRNIFVKDSRINPSHTFVFEDHPYYDSHCLTKDIKAFASKYNSELISTIYKINRSKRK